MAARKMNGFKTREREGWSIARRARKCRVVAGGIASTVVGGVMSADAAEGAQESADRATAAGTAAADKQYALALKQDERAEQQWLRYQQTYMPLEDQMIDESRGMGSMANQNKAASDAAAGVVSSFSRARERLTKNPGVNPSSQQHQQELSKIGLAEAATSAAAQTSAREAVKDRAAASMTNAVSLGKGLPAAASAGAGAASAAVGSAAGIYGGLAASARQQGRDAGDAAYGIGKSVGGIFGSAPVQNWMNGGAQASFANTTAGSSGFGTGLAYGNQDLGTFL